MEQLLSWNFLAEDLEENAIYLDCRSEELYEKSTIRGAHGAAFIKKPYGSGPQSMQKLSGFVKTIQKIAADKTIIAFDEGEGMYASRMTWVLQASGINARMLGTRFQDFPDSWEGEGRGQIECESSVDSIVWKGIATIGFLQQNLTRVQLLDVRTPEEYDGVLPRLTQPEDGSICGRIPGSMNWDWRTLYDTEGHIRQKMSVISDIKRIGLIQERPTVIYDYNGARSCTTALVLSRCGYRQVQVYMGSWMEWRKTALPKQNTRAFVGAALV